MRCIVPALLIAALAGYAAAALHLPLPWMLGPLFSIAILRTAGLRLEAPSAGRRPPGRAMGDR